MFANTPAYAGLSVSDLEAAEGFYCGLLGLRLLDDSMGLHVELGGGGELFIYQKADHVPANYTVLTFEVPNIDHAVSDLKKMGIEMQRYKHINPSTDIHRGKMTGQGPDIAWFTDPSGNILAVIET